MKKANRHYWIIFLECLRYTYTYSALHVLGYCILAWVVVVVHISLMFAQLIVKLDVFKVMHIKYSVNLNLFPAHFLDN